MEGFFGWEKQSIQRVGDISTMDPRGKLSRRGLEKSLRFNLGLLHRALFHTVKSVFIFFFWGGGGGG